MFETLTRHRLPAFASLFFFGVFTPSLCAQQPPANPDVISGIQIVNGTCVPEINLTVNKLPLYSHFQQGLYTGDAYVPYVMASYRAEDPVSKRISPETVESFESKKKQTLLITGDFSITDPPEDLPQPPPAVPAPNPTPAKAYPPNVQFRILSHTLTSGEEKVRYRFFNAVPRQTVTLRKASESTGGQAILPGKTYSYSKQTGLENYLAKFNDKEVSVAMRQEGHTRNATIVFFLKNGQPAFSRIFENTEESEKAAAELN